ncbi:hypothetical protein Celaphus_00011954, partial [Cervus elaphus hippelaphus]
MKEAILNQGKLAKLQAKKKVVLTNATENNKKVQFSLKKLGVNNTSFEEMTMFTSQEQQSDQETDLGLRRLTEALPKKSVDGKVPLATGEDDDDEVLDLDKNFDKAFKKGAN